MQHPGSTRIGVFLINYLPDASKITAFNLKFVVNFLYGIVMFAVALAMSALAFVVGTQLATSVSVQMVLVELLLVFCALFLLQRTFRYNRVMVHIAKNILG